MSIRVMITFGKKNEDFLVEITDDLRIVFLDRDMEYDLSMCEFGEKIESCRLYYDWYDVPLEIITLRMGLSESFVARLATDWAEHVLPIFESQYRSRKAPREAIDLMRTVIDFYESSVATSGGRLLDVLFDTSDDEDSVYYKKRTPQDVNSVRESVSSMRRRLKALRDSVEKALIPMNIHRDSSTEVIRAVASSLSNGEWRVGNAAAEAAGFSVESGFTGWKPKDEAYKAASAAERAWQIRRFMDVYAADVEGLERPPLRATK